MRGRERLAPDNVAHLGEHALLPLRRAGEQIERPGQGLGGGLVAGGEEGQQIVDQLLFRHRRPGLGVLRQRQARQQVVAAEARRAAAREDGGDRVAQHRGRPGGGGICPGTTSNRGRAAWPRRSPRRWWRARASEARRICAASRSAPPANMVAEITWKVVSVMSLVDRPHGPRRAGAPARDLVLGGLRHGRHQAGEIGGAEQRRRRAPLPAPARRPRR